MCGAKQAVSVRMFYVDYWKSRFSKHGWSWEWLWLFFLLHELLMSWPSLMGTVLCVCSFSSGMSSLWRKFPPCQCHCWWVLHATGNDNTLQDACTNRQRMLPLSQNLFDATCSSKILWKTWLQMISLQDLNFSSNKLNDWEEEQYFVQQNWSVRFLIFFYKFQYFIFLFFYSKGTSIIPRHHEQLFSRSAIICSILQYGPTYLF